MAKCIFCGDPAGASHRIPYDYIPDATVRFPEGEVLVDFPCCVECRELLDEVMTGSLEGAARYLASTYRELYSRALTDFRWKRSEIDELRPNLRTAIEHYARSILMSWPASSTASASLFWVPTCRKTRSKTFFTRSGGIWSPLALMLHAAGKFS